MNWGEFMETISFNNQKEINNKYKVYKNDDYGSNSTIYNYNNKELLKVFKNKGSINTLYTLNKIRDLDNIKTIIKVNKFLEINNQFYGYSMNKANGRMLLNIKHNNIRELLNTFLYLEEDVNILTENLIYIDDLNPANMIYNRKNNFIHIIDCDRYFIDENKRFSDIRYNNYVNLYLNILSALSNMYFMFHNDYKFYNLMKDTIISSGFINNIYNFFNYYIEELEDTVNKKIESVDDFRKALKLTKIKNK